MPPSVIMANLILPETVPGIQNAQRILNGIAAVAGLGSIKLAVLNIANECRCIVADSSTLRAGRGLFSITASDAELAAVLSYAVAQILLKHNRELSHRSRLESRVLQHPVSRALYFETWVLALLAAPLLYYFNYPLGVAVLMSAAILEAPDQYVAYLHRDNARVKEDEADCVGMLLMAEAGYDPDAMVTFWKGLMERRARLHANMKQRGRDAVAGNLGNWAAIRAWTPTRTADGLERAELIRDYVVASKGGGDLPNYGFVSGKLPFGLHAWTKFKEDVAWRGRPVDDRFDIWPR
nr:hypothetical protein B0A51_15609 [Rachicladosporium sp. CCFEE 5018]